MRYLITFMSTGGVYVDASSEDEARKIFEESMQEDAAREMAMNGIDITDVQEEEPDDDSVRLFLTSSLIYAGHEAIEEFVGYSFPDGEGPRKLSDRIQEAFEQMPEEELSKYLTKYKLNNKKEDD